MDITTLKDIAACALMSANEHDHPKDFRQGVAEVIRVAQEFNGVIIDDAETVLDELNGRRDEWRD